MILTEDEARKKRCPFGAGAVASGAPLGEAGGHAHIVVTHCIGAGCMSWRWVEVNVCDARWRAAVKRCATEIGDETPNKSKAAARVAEDREAYGLPSSPVDGYCGAAGVPHELPRLIR